MSTSYKWTICYFNCVSYNIHFVLRKTFFYVRNWLNVFISCLNHLNEHLYVSAVNNPIFGLHIIQKYVFIVNFAIAYLSCLHHVNKLRMMPHCHFCFSVVSFYNLSTYCMYFAQTYFICLNSFFEWWTCFHTDRRFAFFFFTFLYLYEK